MDPRAGESPTAENPAAGGRPLTRRELRARAAAEEAARAAAEDGGADRVAGAPDEDAAPGAAAPGTAAPESWEATVGWALRGELPPVLPPEPPEPDDVVWTPVTAPTDAEAAAPRRVSVLGGPGLGLGYSAVVPGPVGERDPRREVREAPVVPAWGAVAAPAPTAPGDAQDVDAADAEVAERAEPSARPDEAEAPRVATPEAEAPEAEAAEPADAPAKAPAHADDDWAPAETWAPEAVVPTTTAAAPARTTPLRPLPTLEDLLAARPEPADGPAELGWRAAVRRLTGGVVRPGPGPDERLERRLVAAVQRPLDGPRTIVVINPKGGAHKTTATLLLAATFGRLRGGYTLAWDNNETRGTLGWRARHTHHQRTAVDLLEDLARFAEPSSSRVGDLDAYVRSQGAAQFDVLASDEDAASAASVDGFAFRALHRTLLRFYRLLVIDTGNNMRASNWQAAIEAADQVVVVSTMREDTAQSAAWALDALRATGHEEIVRRAVTVLSQPAPRIDSELTARLHDHFGRLTRAVLEVPYEPALVSGGPIDLDGLSRSTRRAWLHVAAAIADGL